MHQCIDWLRIGRLFSTLDPNLSLWQVETDEHDLEKIAFTRYHKLYSLAGRPVGLKKFHPH